MSMNSLELIFPSGIYCVSCGNLIDESRPYALCDRCSREIRWSPVTRMRDESHCYDSVYSCAVYEGRVKSILWALKYKGSAYIAAKIAEMMAAGYSLFADEATGELPQPDILTCVPMNAVKKGRRGYDQAELIGRALATKLGFCYGAGLLVMHYETEVMSRLSGAARKANLTGAFGPGRDATSGGCAGRNIMLVDDVYTTGSTADACASVLKEAGAARVDVYTFAAATEIISMD